MTEPLFTSDNDTVDRVLTVLRSIPTYPYSDEIDRPQVRAWIDEFPTKDLVYEAEKWKTWLSENPRITKPPKGKSTNYRGRFRNWLQRPALYGSTRRAGPSTGAHRPEAYGPTSEALERW